MVGFASRGPKSEIICVIHILFSDTNDLIMLMWSESTSVVWMGLMCSHSSISQDYVVDQGCVCVWVKEGERGRERGPMCIFCCIRSRHTYCIVVDMKAKHTHISENILYTRLTCNQKTKCEFQSICLLIFPLKSTSHFHDRTLCLHSVM